MNIPRCFLRVLGIPACLGILAIAGPTRAATPPVVPDGYYLVMFASGIPSPTSMAFGPDGWLYVTRLDGVVTALYDTDGNGQADIQKTFATGFTTPLGVAVRNGQVYVTSRNRVTRLTDTNGDHVADTYEPLITNLPAGKHWTTDVVFGPDGNMYVGVGSNSNRGAVTDPWHATILRFTPDGTFLEVFASGLRNPYGLAFNYAGQLFATDNGPGPDTTWSCFEAPDELNWIVSGGNYGFPTCFGVGDCADVSAQCSPPPCGAGDCETGSGCLPSMKDPIAFLETHSSSDGIAFGDNFTGYTRDDLFIAQFGQTEYVAGCPTSFGHKVVRVGIQRHGNKWEATGVEDFITGLDLPLDVAVGPDGALYIAEFGLGIVRRVFRTEPGAVPEPGPAVTPALPFFRFAPNPARREARAEWAVPPGLPVTFRVFDVLGRRIMEWDSGSGNGAVWSLTDRSGRRVPPGLYFIEARSAAGRGFTRLVVTD